MSSPEPQLDRPGSPGLSAWQLGRASLTYAVGGLAYKGLALLTVPILARLLTPAQLGLLDLAAVLASLISLVVLWGLDQGVPYLEPRARNGARVWGSAVSIVVVGGVAALLLVLAFRDPLAMAVTGSDGSGPSLAAAGLYGAVMGLSAFALVTLRLRASPRAYAVAAFLTVALEMAAALTIAVLVEDPVPLMVVAWAVGSAIVAVPVLVRFLPRLARPDRETLAGLLRFGAPLVPATVAWIVGDLLIRAVLARQGDLAALGEYGIAARIASVLALVVTGFGVAWYPYLYRSADADVVTRARSALAGTVAALGAAAVVLTLLAPEIVALVAGDAYAEAAGVVAPLSGGMVAMGAFHVLSGVVGATGSTRNVGLAAVVGGAVQVVAALLLVPALELVGAGLASLLGQVAAAGVVSILVWRRVPIAGPAAVAVIASALAITAAHAAVDLPLVARLAAAVVSVIVIAVPVARSRGSVDG